MRSINISHELSGKKIDRAIKEAFPKTPIGAIYKALRKKDIRVNGVRIKEDYVVNAGDQVDVYIVDSILEGMDNKESPVDLNVVYEDVNLIIVNKKQGMPVHPDNDTKDNTLIDIAIKYLERNGEFQPNNSDFTPSLCHRLDRNTGGLVLIAKNEQTLNIMNKLIKEKQIKKLYQCYVSGKMPKNQEELKAYLEKDENKSKVFISNKKTNNSLEIITRYKVIDYNEALDISLLEIDLVTGRTHQIRAHLAHIGHQVIGDGKYGTNQINKPLGIKQQMLWAYKLMFSFDNAGILNYLKNKTFEVKPEFEKIKGERQ